MKRVINQCDGKIPFKTKEEANDAARHLNEMGGLRVKSYKCGVCMSFHYGHESKGKKLNPRDNRKRQRIDYDYKPSTHLVDIKRLKKW